MRSKRTKAFKKLFDKLPDQIRENARKQYGFFCENQSHPSLRTKLIGSTRNKKFKVDEAFVFARESAFPEPGDLHKYVYAK
ncbi:MAG: hypothetical protein KJ573_07070 [Proteobacteria bacterium]|nr:hypothetical protein [Desulfobacterales bacterium]MBU0735908.1 hypothetical protein [Pseudomonadota bacterium]MBU1903338.1 hypothetical protein [Pseudomonadota bacterium]